MKGLRRLALSLTVWIGVTLLGACVATQGPAEPSAPQSFSSRTIFKGTLAYPTTKIPVSENLTIRHEAKPVDKRREGMLPTLGGEGMTAYSTYEFSGGQGRAPFSVPSILTLPSAADGELRSYLEENQAVEILASDSGRTFLIEEDRTTAYPIYAYLVLQQDAGGNWKWFDLRLPAIPTQQPGSAYGDQPAIAGLEDDRIWLAANGKTWAQSLLGVENGASLNVEFPVKP